MARREVDFFSRAEEAFQDFFWSPREQSKADPLSRLGRIPWAILKRGQTIAGKAWHHCAAELPEFIFAEDRHAFVLGKGKSITRASKTITATSGDCSRSQSSFHSSYHVFIP